MSDVQMCSRFGATEEGPAVAECPGTFLTGVEVGAQIGYVTCLLRSAKSINASKVDNSLTYSFFQSEEGIYGMPGTAHAEVKLLVPPGET